MYGATLPAQAATAARLAVHRAVPARVGCAQATSIVGINRRPRNAEGRVVTTGVNPTGLVDPQVAVVRVDATDGQPLATLVHCGVHGTVFKGDNCACSADVTGAARAGVSASGDPTCVAFGGYTNGCIGYLATAKEHAAGGYEIEWMPVVYGYYEGLLMPPVPETADEVVDAAIRLIDGLYRGHHADQSAKDYANQSIK